MTPNAYLGAIIPVTIAAFLIACVIHAVEGRRLAGFIGLLGVLGASLFLCICAFTSAFGVDDAALFVITAPLCFSVVLRIGRRLNKRYGWTILTCPGRED